MGILSNISTTCIRTSDGRREQTTPCRRRSHFCLVPINKCLFSPAPSDQRRGTEVKNTSTWAFRNLSEVINTSIWAFRHLAEIKIDHNGDLIKGLQMC